MSAVLRPVATLVAGTLIAAITASPVSADPVRDAQWHLEFLGVRQAHEIGRGDGIVVAVIDTGVDARHSDLQGSVLRGKDLTTADRGGIAHQDTDGHGTAMAGLIAAHGRALGIAPNATILPIRDTETSFGFENHLPEGLNWAIDQGAKVVCIAAVTMDHSELRAAVTRAIAEDVVVVAGVGNYPTSTNVGFPAAYPGVIAAAGVDRKGEQAAVSVEGPEVVLAAPAVDIVSTGLRAPRGNGYRVGTGTSDATAIIAGAAALVRARYPDLSAAEVVHRLTATADDKGLPGRDNEYGYGVVNLVRALTADVPPLPTTRPPPTSPTTAAPPTGTPVDIPWLLVLSGLSLIAALVVSIVAYARGRRVS
jgi:type VII secretion-associated serine protease mycosin